MVKIETKISPAPTGFPLAFSPSTA